MSTSEVIHCVYLKYNSDVSAEQQADVFRQFYELKDACKSSSGEPYIAKIQCGSENTSTEGAGKGFDHAFVVTFSSAEDVKYYVDEDPKHDEFKKFVKPLLADAFIFDFKPTTPDSTSPSA
ncbi:hypothetical protein CF327_g4407 [Tilletia walkeri]|uniref:Stress-response A/B barrel domain-containing protein n=1 Tax=Tilletia walkeri TaxID=117179 RepID=A0A8X7N3V8_9BASI|nr:hypothetical protein CF327_g4407 [Tilletia walkeri]KAE8266542.1 hypothetical protein A4X09_0g5811 [Tilletia walkeri]